MLLKRAAAMASTVFTTQLVAIMAGLPLALLGLRAFASAPMLAGLDVLSRLGSFALFLYLVVTLSYFEYSPKTARSGFPRYAIMLPVSTRFLVGFHLLAVGLLLCCYFFAWFRWVVPLPLNGAELSALSAAVGVFFVWCNVAMWALGQARTAAMLVLLVSIGMAAASLVPILNEAPPAYPLSAAGGAAVLATMFASGVYCAYAAVLRTRSGTQGALLKRFSRSSLSLGQALKAGASARDAQTWYERRVFGMLLPRQAMLLAGALLAVQFIPGLELARLGASVLVLAAFIVVVPLFGFNMAKEHFDATGTAMSTFWATRPLSDDALAQAKLAMLGRSVLLSAAIVYGAMPAAWYLGGSLAALTNLIGRFAQVEGRMVALALVSLLVVVPTAFCWTVAANLMSVGLRGDAATSGNFKWYREAGVSLLLLAGISIAQADDVAGTLIQAGWTAMALLGALWVVLVLRLKGNTPIALLMARLADPAKVASLLLAYALGVVALLHVGIIAKLVVSGLMLLLCLYAIVPFVLAPATLALNRHR